MTEFIKIGDFANVITGGTPSTLKIEYWQDGDIPWLNSGELNQDIVTFSNNFITAEGLKNSSTRLMPPETVLIALTGATTGKIGYLTFEACANQSVTGILPSKKHFPKYLYYYLNSIRNRVLNDAYGGAQPHISQGYVKNLKIPLPPLETQKKIASILDKADELRQNDKKILEKYDQLAQSVFLEMFGDIDSNRKLKITSLGDVVKEVKDGPHVSPSYANEGTPILSTRNIRPFELDLTDMKYVSEGTFKELTKRFKPQRNDVLITKGGTTGYAKLVNWDWEFCIWVHIAALRPDLKLINPRYLEAALNTHYCYRQSQKYTHGIANKDLGLKRLINIKFPLPPMNDQNKFAEIYNGINQQKEMSKQSLQKSEELFQSLLQKAFRGELV